MQYRNDIDGLRAVSVLLVILFHYYPSLVPGGFVGVDCFFVISGYLITGLLLKNLEERNASLVSFYERRIRRIVPALLATVLLTLVSGWVLLLPGDYRTTAYSGLAAIGAASNVYFLYNTGYFDQSSELMPLLHTWSLGVEEQFYIVWPLLLFALYRLRGRKRHILRRGILVIIAVSFSFNLWQMGTAPKEAFFLPFGRAWELAIGGLLVLLPHPSLPRVLRELIPALGLAVILVSGFWLNRASPFPGLNALMPTLGTALVVYGGGQDTFAARLLSTPPFTGLGKISYSLYLVHWPVIVLWRHYATGYSQGLLDIFNPLGAFKPIILPWTEASILLVASFALSVISYRFVEQPFRRLRRPRWGIYGIAGAGSGCVALMALAIFYLNGVPQRIPPEMVAITDVQEMWAWPCPQTVVLPVTPYDNPSRNNSRLCGGGASWQEARGRAILWGDSHAEHLMPMLDWAGRLEETAFVLVDPCPAILRKGNVERSRPEVPNYTENCTKQRGSVLALLRERADIDTVLLSASWSTLSRVLHRGISEQRPQSTGAELLYGGMKELLDELGPSKKVVLFLNIPSIQNVDPANCVLSNSTRFRRPCAADLEKLSWQTFDGEQRPIFAALRAAAAARPNVIVVDIAAALCANEGRCRAWLNGELLYRDQSHIRRNLSEPTVAALGDLLNLRQVLRQPIGALTPEK